MKLNIVCVGFRPKSWVQQGFETYQKRMPTDCSIHWIEITPPKRKKNSNIERLKSQEWDRVKKTLVKLQTEYVFLLDEAGKQWTSMTLADELQNWREIGQDVVLVIGGADGLSADVKNRFPTRALSRMTLPHGLARILLAEQLYRAISICQNHPYHRA